MSLFAGKQFQYLRDGSTIEGRATIGGKAFNLAELTAEKFNVPSWFVVTTEAFNVSANWQPDSISDIESLRKIKQSLFYLEANQKVKKELEQALACFAKHILFAVRSSAADEDSSGASFAGQLDSFLCVRSEDVAQKVADVWRSAFSEHLLTYRKLNMLSKTIVPPAVIVQAMVAADKAGVAFSIDPVTGASGSVISSVFGLGEPLVSGESNSDLYRVGDAGHVISEAGHKSVIFRQGRGCVEIEELVEPDTRLSLNEDEARSVASLVQKAAECFECPQDIEWAIAGDELFILQTRPITTVASQTAVEAKIALEPKKTEDPKTELWQEISSSAKAAVDPRTIDWQEIELSPKRVDAPRLVEPETIADWQILVGPETTVSPTDPKTTVDPKTIVAPEIIADPKVTVSPTTDSKGQLYIWDNSNIGESYHGITTPLTFSFARKAYAHVYIEFCRLMGVSEATVKAKQNIFPNMLGFIQGRIYYNLLNWYRLIAVFPGYRANKKFMEQMMGVRESLPEDIAPKAVTSDNEKFNDQYNFIRNMIKIGSRFISLPEDIVRFNMRFKIALRETDGDLSLLTVDELASAYRKLEAKLLFNWDAPLINDFFAMIFFGSLRNLTERWCKDVDGTLQNNLIAGEGGIISAEPPKLMAQAASIASQNSGLVAMLMNGDVAAIKIAMAKYPEFEQLINQYLAKFGGRCIGELKLESFSLNDDPLSFFRTIGQLASNKINGQAELGHGDNLSNVRKDAEKRAQKFLETDFIKTCIFIWVLNNTRVLVKQRENLRFERTRLFARVREIVLAIATKLSSQGVIDKARNVFYLELEELLGYIEGTATSTNLNGLIAVRKKEIDSYRLLPQPADRIETYGPIYLNQDLCAEVKGEKESNNNNEQTTLKGTGCCRGKVKAKVRVILDPKNAAPLNGDILVARRTDPGWIIVFPQASGILVEYGSLLSHSAIVARELGIPAIVGIPGLIGKLKDGDWVEFDGSTGIINKLEHADAV